MGDLGLSGPYGVASMQEAVRQRILDQLSKQQQEFTNGLSLRTADRADRQQQILEQEHAALLAERTQAAKETGAERGVKNLSLGDLLTPEQGKPFQGTTQSSLFTPDQTLPSTQMAAGATMPGADGAATAPTMTEQAPRLTGQLRFMGTPEQRQSAAQDAETQQMIRDPNTPPVLRQFLRARSGLPKGENIPPQVLVPPTDPTKTHETNRLFDVAHPLPVQPVVLQTDAGAQLVNRGTGTAAPIKDASGAAIGPKTPDSLKVEAAHKQEALGYLDQLDQAIEAAKDLIGPGEGRISNLEQMAGNADPRIQALGTKMLLAKMKVDAGIGGSRAAASPQLLARWDNLLANKVTPEGLKAATQAMREILGVSGGSGPAAGGATGKVRRYNPATGKLE